MVPVSITAFGFNQIFGRQTLIEGGGFGGDWDQSMMDHFNPASGNVLFGNGHACRKAEWGLYGKRARGTATRRIRRITISKFIRPFPVSVKPRELQRKNEGADGGVPPSKGLSGEIQRASAPANTQTRTQESCGT